MQLIAKNREVNREAQLAEIERQGEEQIRVQLTQKGLSEERTALARDKERAREAREEAFRLEQARAAERANRIAMAALIFVGASFLLSLGALFKRRR